MGEREFESMIEQLMKLDFSIGTETFRDNLLASCLAVLNMGDECMVVPDEELELLAAAGGSFVFEEAGMDSRSLFGDNRDTKDLP
ncbi:MAG: hypothetical protein IJI68_06580 [Eggerthellaceae bacterium]|nr:hypothetical protein [Eggerthellaceae bacterium]